MRGLYAVTMGKDYKGPAEVLLGRGADAKLLSRLRPDQNYAELKFTEEEAARFMTETRLTCEPIEKSRFAGGVLDSPAEPVSDQERAEIMAKSKRQKKGGG